MSMSVIERIIENENTKKDMILNDSYIKWLEKFTEEYQNFEDNSFLYCPEEVSKEDYTKVETLGLFFDLVDDYAKKNYIYAQESDFGAYYTLKYNDIIFEISVVSGQGVVFGCDRIEDVEKTLVNVIDYNDLKENKESDKAKFVKEVITDLSAKLAEVITLGVPIEAIEDCVKDLKKSTK